MAGTPVVKTPLNVRVYVPFKVLPVDCTVTVLCGAAGVIDAEESVQVEPLGTPPQVSDTDPVKPLFGTIVIV